MTTPISDMNNLGPKSAKMLAEIDIYTDADLRRIGAVEAWHRVNFFTESGMSLVGLYAMEAALLGVDWRHLSDDHKAQLKTAAGR